MKMIDIVRNFTLQEYVASNNFFLNKTYDGVLDSINENKEFLAEFIRAFYLIEKLNLRLFHKWNLLKSVSNFIFFNIYELDNNIAKSYFDFVVSTIITSAEIEKKKHKAKLKESASKKRKTVSESNASKSNANECNASESKTSGSNASESNASGSNASESKTSGSNASGSNASGSNASESKTSGSNSLQVPEKTPVSKSKCTTNSSKKVESINEKIQSNRSCGDNLENCVQSTNETNKVDNISVYDNNNFGDNNEQSSNEILGEVTLYNNSIYNNKRKRELREKEKITSTDNKKATCTSQNCTNYFARKKVVAAKSGSEVEDCPCSKNNVVAKSGSEVEDCLCSKNNVAANSGSEVEDCPCSKTNVAANSESKIKRDSKSTAIDCPCSKNENYINSGNKIVSERKTKVEDCLCSKNADDYSSENNNHSWSLSSSDAASNTTIPPVDRKTALAFITRYGYKVDVENWYEFYQSKNWLIGANVMTDWKASIKLWHKRKCDMIKLNNTQNMQNSSREGGSNKKTVVSKYDAFISREISNDTKIRFDPTNNVKL